ncbi:MAG: pseudouridine synthase [Candidatus Edwardsbacteria bacterium]|jgi:23S rRNA pseudouridine2457 synthase|nr:pseudouridine synthase [Candidatus Edwardsbacteria bacterium]
MLIAFNKPYGVLSQFTRPTDAGRPVPTAHRTLSQFGFPRGVYPVGRLDADSEGLLLLSDEPGLNSKLLDPVRGHARAYWAQVEDVPGRADLDRLERGTVIGGRRTLPARARLLDPQPDLPDRVPPIRVRTAIPTCWIELVLTEGRNRQVRRMTAAVGFPTLRLVRVRIGAFALAGVAPGEWRVLGQRDRRLVMDRPDRNTC